MSNLPFAAPTPPVPPKKLSVGCIAALTATCGLIAGVVGLVLLFFLSQTGQNILGPTKILLGAQSAPGAKELRALGCASASVVDLEEQKVAFDRAIGGDSGGYATAARVAIVCSANRQLRGASTCDAVASTYVSAVGGRAAGIVDIRVVTATMKPICAGRYDALGEFIESIPANE